MWDHIRLDHPRPGVARVVLARPQARNAQSPQLLRELDAALLEAAGDPDVRVIVLAADGPDFSSGHDLKAAFGWEGRPLASMERSADGPGIEGHYAFECEMFLGLCLRWRDLPKPTIAQVQGRTIAGGLMLVWPMDLVIASEDATFQDPVTAFGVNGVEYFAHLWEVGARKAKEMLFTGDAITAREAERLGMVNHVVPLADLEEYTLDLASRIARRPAFGVRLAKTSINQALDAQGLRRSMEAALALHNLGHANNLARFGQVVHPDGAEMIRAGVVRP
jgi:enoyl-CoA hydratase